MAFVVLRDGTRRERPAIVPRCGAPRRTPDVVPAATHVADSKSAKLRQLFFGSFRKGFSRPAAPAAHALIECRAELFATTAKASLFGHCFEAFYGWTPRLSLLTINEVVNKILCSLFGSRRLAGSTVDLHKTAKGRGNKVLAFRLAQQPVDRSSRAHFDFAQGSQNCVVCFPKREAVLCRRLANLPQPQRHREMPK
jgi:hypothetical protein